MGRKSRVAAGIGSLECGEARFTALGWWFDTPMQAALAALPKSDERKIVLACLLREKTSVSNDWIASRLAMGLPGSASRMISAGRTDKNVARKRNELAGILFVEEKAHQ
jgi:hypothetical protein